MLCAEDASRIAPADLQQPDGTLLRNDIARDLLEICAIWPHDGTPPDLAQPVKSDVPALLLSGALDPVTPPPWGEAVAKTLPNSRHLVAPGYGHLVTPHGCAPRLVAEFVRAGTAAKLDAGCLTTTKRPPFFVDRLGPAS